jgi:hypothetical protein
VASGASVLSVRDACAVIRRPRRRMIGRNEPKALDSAKQLVRAHVRVALRGVEVLVATSPIASFAAVNRESASWVSWGRRLDKLPVSPRAT